MISFVEYLSFWRITDVLISKRASLADKRHRNHLLHLMSPDIAVQGFSNEDNLLLSIMPPRKRWVKLNIENRYKQCQDGQHRQKINTVEINKKSIRLTIYNDLKNNYSLLYINKLKSFVAEVQRRVKDKNIKFSPPYVFPTKKDKKTCRPLCTFKDLYESTILILANRYLTKNLDKFFYEESLAFRSVRQYHGKKCVTSHHDAIVRIKEYLSAHSDQSLYVSECDLKKFYDTVSHKVVKSSYYRLMERLSNENPGCTFDEINRIFEAYLGCYSFPRNVYSLNDNEQFWAENRIDTGHRKFEWVEADIIKHHRFLSNRRMMKLDVGVPQGGALSGLIANVVLNSVDWEIAGLLGEDAIYLRYCDDMIIISSNREKCLRLFDIYYNIARSLELFPHEPEEQLPFGKSGFWEGKSKRAYPWAMNRSDASEWIGFVGYEMRRDGLLRIRLKSFLKEIKKQKEVTFDKVLNKLDNKARVSDMSILNSIKHKLVSMSVGKVEIWNYMYVDGEMCWSCGFKELERNPILNRQLHTLDRHRNQLLSWAEKYLSNMRRKGDVVVRKDLNQIQKNEIYLGLPQSYYYQYLKN